LASTFDFKGGPELRRALQGMEKKFLREMGKALEDEAQTIMQLGVRDAPEDTGDLAAGTDVQVTRRRGGIEGAASFTRERAAAVHEAVHWGRKVEGTEGFHWYGEAAADWEPKAQQRIVQRLQALTNEKGKGAAATPKRKPSSRPSATAKAFKRTAKRVRKAATRTAKKAVKAGRKLARRARKATRKALR